MSSYVAQRRRGLPKAGQRRDQHERRQHEGGDGAAGGEQAPDQGLLDLATIKYPRDEQDELGERVPDGFRRCEKMLDEVLGNLRK